MKFISTVVLTLAVAAATGCSHQTTSSQTTDTGAPAASGAAAPMGAAGGGGQNRGRRFGRLLMTLGLTDAQKEQIRAIMRNARQQSQGADPATRRANMQAAYAKIDTVLTPAQRVKFHQELDAMRAQYRAQQQQQPAASPAP